MPVLSEKHRSTLESNAWFAGLAPQIREDALSRAVRMELAAGDCLFARGDEFNGFFGILEGAIRIDGFASNGQEAILTFYEPGAWFGEISAFDDLPRLFNAHAHQPTVLLKIGRADFDALLDRHPALCRLFLRLECSRLRLIASVFEEFTTQTLEERLANRLVTLIASFNSSSSATSFARRIELRLSQEMLGNLVGATRQRVSQVLKHWARDGLIEQRQGYIVIFNEAELQRIALRQYVARRGPERRGCAARGAAPPPAGFDLLQSLR